MYEVSAEAPNAPIVIGMATIARERSADRTLRLNFIQNTLSFISEKEEYSQLFKGNYLTNYSWAETTLAELTGNIYNKGSQ